MEEVPEITHRVYLDVDIDRQHVGTAFASHCYMNCLSENYYHAFVSIYDLF